MAAPQTTRTDTRVGYLIVMALLAGLVGWIAYQMVAYSPRDGGLYRLTVIFVPVVLVGLIGVAVVFGQAFLGRGASVGGAPPERFGHTVEGVLSLLVGLILAGAAVEITGVAPGNPLLGALADAARFLVAPFRELFLLSRDGVQVAVNWSIAAAAYLIAGFLLTKALEALAGRSHGDGRGDPAG